jgi:hypothetical protein
MSMNLAVVTVIYMSQKSGTTTKFPGNTSRKDALLKKWDFRTVPEFAGNAYQGHLSTNLDGFVERPRSVGRYISLSLRRMPTTSHDTRCARLEPVQDSWSKRESWNATH